MKQRIISAIIMLLIMVPIFLIGKLPFAFLMLLLGMIALDELLRLKTKLPQVMKIFSFLMAITFICYGAKTDVVILGLDIRFLIVPLLIYLIMLVFLHKPKEYNYQDAFQLMGITLFIGLGFGSLIRIRNMSLYLIIYLFLITCLTDTFALFSGKLFGKHKLAPKISPNKTIEGLIGGTLIGTIIASLFYLFVIKIYHSVFMVFLLTLFLSLIDSLGDLIMSSIKRSENIKDFGNLIPGHGGILDRFDSIIFVTITYILIASLF